jgi:AraC-like DNA-binding protein
MYFHPYPEHSLYFYPRNPLVVHYLEEQKTITCPPSIVIGPQVKRVNLSLGYDHIVLRVGFRTGGLHRLLHQPLHEVVDFTCNTEDYFGSALREVNEQLSNTADYTTMVQLVQQFLLKQLSKLKAEENIDRALTMLLKTGGNTTIDYLAKESCLSFRQFERKCKERIGLSPKLYARIVRFSKAYRMREANPHLSWTAIAHITGYFDQMHLIRDFKAFAGGVTPTHIDKELAQSSILLQADLQL